MTADEVTGVMAGGGPGEGQTPGPTGQTGSPGMDPSSYAQLLSDSDGKLI